MTSIRRYFPRQYFAPVALLLLTTFGALFGLLFYVSDVQDRLTAERDRQRVMGAIQAFVELSAHDLQDYAVWDDAVRHVAQDFDPVWIDDNISTYLGRVQGYTHIFVMDGERTIYAFEAGQRLNPPGDAVSVIGSEVLLGLQAARGASKDDPVAGGFSKQGEVLSLYAAAMVAPLTDKVLLPTGREIAIVITRTVDDALLASLAERHQTPAFSFVRGTADPDQSTQALRGRSGNVLASIKWTPEAPGTSLVYSLLPGFLAIGASSIFAAGLILKRARREADTLRRSREGAQFLAYHDALTGLPNRRKMLEVLRDALHEGAQLDLLYMDLDGFKDTNDVYGHAVGDALLKEAAQRIVDAVEGDDLVARTGGDEFAILLSRADPEKPQRIAAAILAGFRTACEVGHYRVRIGASIGHARVEPGITDEELMRRADVAMYAAKADGRRCWRTYDRALDQTNDARREIEEPLRRAIDEDRIEAAFQPIVEAGTGAITGVEALARWNDPELGRIPPDRFIRVAEQTGLITELGCKMLSNACRAAKPWNVNLSVNLSPAQFWDGDLISMVTGCLEETGFPPERLELEITEDYLLRRPEDAQRVLEILRAKGISISLDDFGAGYASIGYLQRLPLDRIKIDRSFVARAAEDREAAALSGAIVGLGRALGLRVTAEGVETEAQALVMREIGCSHLQGWLYGYPLTAEEMTARLSARG